MRSRARPGIDLSKARILVTNDDGINAPGLAVLLNVAQSLSDDVWVVAPEIEQSGAGHSLTLRRPLQVRKIADRRFAVDGTPTDCVLLAVNRLIDGKRPDLVLSGVNRGANLGEDVTYSGTIAAAMEATLLDIPSIALSQLRIGQTVPWGTAEKHAPDVIRRLVKFDWPKGVLMNVNFPTVPAGEVKGIRAARQGRRISAIEVVPITDPAGRPYLWIGDFTNDDSVGKGTDLDVTRHGAIAVTPLHLDLTHMTTLERLKGLLD
ncbi:MAG TPA: 5'/3'-nucleotidase SurE [Hypericibacter adhaerens]|jgi:5'-nucleotidase|uniref:5'-nucleotidase SurE n=1 Tax=Hypericibacter adhaerens TaxID=2602016 RepID=A0A5J6MYT8_9PROT|nr:5'/3'-nucleotidase SurE [Hypericibacter adhaerens]QEX22123.1 5'-nucleotidase SurE [Hypericibacter adhaerens]HWA43228.1 5'/3'-nucleotidase SurE [Hypericibacter adhaerens]